MLLFRIAKTSRIKDLSGIGARLFGGRWNQKGTSLLYTAESRSLATVEYLVHVPLTVVPGNLSMATLEVPDKVSIETVKIADLPRTWRKYPAPQKLATVGSKWAQEKRSLLLKVPSVVVAHESNILVNPEHPDMAKLEIADVEKYRLDRRLLGGKVQ